MVNGNIKIDDPDDGTNNDAEPASHAFDQLQPDFVLDAIDSLGLQTDARLFALNSFENRVYQIGIEDKEPVIAKFYRPDRWSYDQIIEEHEFTLELLDAGIDVVAPMRLKNNQTLHEYQGFYIAIFPRRGGHPPNLEDESTLQLIARMLGRMHAVGRAKPFAHRPAISNNSYARQSLDYIQKHWMPSELKDSYRSLGQDLLALTGQIEQQHTDLRPLRCHGDFHLGNMISRDNQLFMVDLDDCRTALAIQDIWLLLPTETDVRSRQLDVIITAYEEFHSFDWREIHLIEYYRTLRVLQQSAWIASRWTDPAFPPAFPWFTNGSYWPNHILTLREQLYELQQSASQATHY